MYIPKNAFYNPNFNPYKVNCEQQVCDGIDAFVNCITNILQGRWGCIKIQLVDALGMPLDLSTVKSIEIIVTNSLGYYVGTWGWTKNKIQPESSQKIEIYQRPVNSSEVDDDYWVEWGDDSGTGSGGGTGSESGSESGEDITNKGLIGIMLSPDQTYIPSGALTAQIVVTTDENGVCNTFVISCLVLANIVQNMAGNICNEEDDGKEIDGKDMYRHLNLVIVPVNIEEIPYPASVQEIKYIKEIEDTGYYYLKGKDQYYQCTYYTPEMDDRDKWVVYDTDFFDEKVAKIKEKLKKEIDTLFDNI